VPDAVDCENLTKRYSPECGSPKAVLLRRGTAFEKMTDPLVTIAMPTYQRPGFLRLALASACRQTYTNLQIVVRDNASSDDTPDVVASFSDRRIEFLQAPVNEGSWQNGNECVRHARGKYLLVLCDDDILGDNYVETLVGFMEKDPEIAASYGATTVIDAAGTEGLKISPNGTMKWTASEICRAWCKGALPLVSGINFLCRTSFFRSLEGRNKFPDGHNSDNAVFMAAGIRGKVLFTDKCFFYYRVHGANSQEKHSSRIRLRGDQEFLKFLDGEVASPTNVMLAKRDWPTLRKELAAFLGSLYFQHFFKFRLYDSSASKIVQMMVISPFATYGCEITLNLLRENRRALLKAIWRGLFR
jgi:glycosyltransferase involved in cell wall biosynthesis